MPVETLFADGLDFADAVLGVVNGAALSDVNRLSPLTFKKSTL